MATGSMTVTDVTVTRCHVITAYAWFNRQIKSPHLKLRTAFAVAIETCRVCFVLCGVGCMTDFLRAAPPSEASPGLGCGLASRWASSWTELPKLEARLGATKPCKDPASCVRSTIRTDCDCPPF